MRLLESYPKIELHSTGEFRMGAPGYGIVIRTKYGVFDFLKQQPTVIGSEDYSSVIEFSNCSRFIRVSGPDVEYVLDSKFLKVSIFKINVRAPRSPDGDWGEGVAFSHEHCVIGREVEHISGFRGTVFIQCPWVTQELASKLVKTYEELRQRQLVAAMDAL